VRATVVMAEGVAMALRCSSTPGAALALVRPSAPLAHVLLACHSLHPLWLTSPENRTDEQGLGFTGSVSRVVGWSAGLLRGVLQLRLPSRVRSLPRTQHGHTRQQQLTDAPATWLHDTGSLAVHRESDKVEDGCFAINGIQRQSCQVSEGDIKPGAQHVR
jgi:hypothetical protein